jgi:hypothetical protein
MTVTAEELAKKISDRADALLGDLETEINIAFPSEEFRRIMWIAIHERIGRKL